MRNEKCPLDLVIRRSQGSFSGHVGEEVVRGMIAMDRRVDRREGSREKC